MKSAWRIILLISLLGCAAPAAAGPDAATADSTANGEGSWLDRNLQRFFGGKNQQAERLDGRALEIVDAYEKYAGLPIEVVIVHQVPGFGDGSDGSWQTTKSLLSGMAKSFQSYTRDSVIRSYLLFQQGDKLDPHALADSEVMLRNLSYINDVRLVIIPLKGEIESVAVVVETTDRWPFGIKGKVVTSDKYSFDLYSESLAGTGIRLSNEFLHKAAGNPDWGYRGRLRKENIRGTFFAAEMSYEDSYRRHSQEIQVDRLLSHPGLHYVGGVSYEHTDDYEREGKPRKYDYFDAWGGDVRPLYDVRRSRSEGRAILVPALRYFQWDFLKRPATVSSDSNRGYHDRQVVLAGLAFQRYKNYKTSYLFGDGETEDLPVGMAANLSMGYEWREFQERTPVFLHLGAISLRHRGDVGIMRATLGGYFRDWRLEEGVFDIGGRYMTTLKGGESFRFRHSVFAVYTLGIRRYPGEVIYLGDRSGVRGLSNVAVKGNQRFVGSLESRVFTHWALWGFRFSFLVFADMGMIGDEESSSIFKEKIYVSTGLGVRLRNPSLVLPTVQMQFSFLTNVDDPGLSLGIKVGNAPGYSLDLPGTKPSITPYE